MSRFQILSTAPAVILPAGADSGISLLCSLSLSAGRFARRRTSAGAISREVKDIFERCGNAVVKIHAVDEHSELSGTGFFVDPTGTIYTAYSVGGEANDFTVRVRGQELPRHLS